MNVLLINACSKYVKQKAPLPLGLLSIGTHLKQCGHEPKIYDRAVEGGSLKKHIRSFRPDILGISVPGGMSFEDALALSETAKAAGVPVVWGGPMASLEPELVLKSGVVDYVIMGDGELAFEELLDALNNKRTLESIDGLAFINDSLPVINKQRAWADLAQLPIIDFSFVDPNRYFFQNRSCKRMLHVYSSKGCTGQCTYCYNSGYAQGVWRARPAEYYIRELKWLVERYQIDGVYFVDDLLSPNREYLQTFCKNLMDSGLNIHWSCDMRTDLCEKEDLQRMFDAGCRWIMFGIESGTPSGQEIINKNLDLDKTKQLMDDCDEIGIFTTITFVTGFPYQTEADLKETIRYILSLNAKVKIGGIFGPFPKSKMFYELVEAKRINIPKTLQEWGSNANMHTIGNNFSAVPSKELLVIINFFLLSVLTNKYDLDGEKRHYWIKRVRFQITEMLKRGNLRSVALVLISAKEFLEVLYYALLFPGIRKKYGLYYSKKKKDTTPSE